MGSAVGAFQSNRANNLCQYVSSTSAAIPPHRRTVLPLHQRRLVGRKLHLLPSRGQTAVRKKLLPHLW